MAAPDIRKDGPPAYHAAGFVCPWCGVAAHQEWPSVSLVLDDDSEVSADVEISFCFACRREAIWYEERMVYPQSTSAPQPHKDLPDELRDDYMEARDIANLSPRGAAALLRLVVQKLLPLVGAEGRDINEQIGYLSVRGLHPSVVEMLDFVRVTGNDAVHPSELILEDNPDLVDALFWAVNEITEQTIGKQKRIEAGTARFSQGIRDGIANRTKKAEQKLAAETAARQVAEDNDN